MVAVDAAISHLQRQWRSASKIGRHYISPTPKAERTVVFVAGQQRSGTNMLMDVLDRHWRTDVFHETDTRAFERYQMRDIDTIRTLVGRSRASHVVIKALVRVAAIARPPGRLSEVPRDLAGAPLPRCQLVDGQAVFDHGRGVEADACRRQGRRMARRPHERVRPHAPA